MGFDYWTEFLPLAKLARKYHLIERLETLQVLRIAQAETKHYRKEEKRIEADIKNLSLDVERKPADYSGNWEKLMQIADSRSKK